MNPPGYPPPGYPQQGAPPPGYAPPGYPPPGYGGYPPGQPPPKKKGMSGCLIAALVVGGIGLLFVIAIVVIAVIVGRKFVGLAAEGMNAPGAAEIRAAGCDMAMVTDLSKVSSLFGLDAGPAASNTPMAIVVCQVSANKTAPSCKDIAATYVQAVPPHTPFTVRVQTQGRSQEDCQEMYDATGQFVQSIKK
jgi:hypothetical protein